MQTNAKKEEPREKDYIADLGTDVRILILSSRNML
jgi:hypothetical protein